MRWITAARSLPVLVALVSAGSAAADHVPPIDWRKDQAALLARLQGAWIVDGTVNHAEALRFDGNRLTRSTIVIPTVGSLTPSLSFAGSDVELLPIAGGGFLQGPASTGVRARDWATAKAALRKPKR
jgi:hypothetical protein